MVRWLWRRQQPQGGRVEAYQAYFTDPKQSEAELEERLRKLCNISKIGGGPRFGRPEEVLSGFVEWCTQTGGDATAVVQTSRETVEDRIRSSKSYGRAKRNQYLTISGLFFDAAKEKLKGK